MATVGHIITGMTLGGLYGPGSRSQIALRMGGLAVVACLPDFDMVIFHVHKLTPYAHRGFTHSLFIAALCGLLASSVVRFAKLPAHAARVGLFVFFASGSHGLLDLASDRGGPVALLWPFSDVRLTSPLRPIPVARFRPPSAFVPSEAKELLAFSPLLVIAFWRFARRARATQDET